MMICSKYEETLSKEILKNKGFKRCVYQFEYQKSVIIVCSGDSAKV